MGEGGTRENFLGYKLNAARVTDEEFLTFVTTHPSEIAVGSFYTPFLSQEKAYVGENSFEVCSPLLTDKSQFIALCLPQNP